MTTENAQLFTIFALSDATGDLAQNLAISASRQFEDLNVKILRRPNIRTEQKIKDVVLEAKARSGIILFTMVSQDLRRLVLSAAQAEGVVAMDVMGPVLDMMSHYFHTLPSKEPGLQYRVTRDYFRRTEAIEFTVQHDEGTGLENLEQADVVLMGISRTSKTPLSIYLAYQGYRCANIPIIKGREVPEKLFQIDRKKLVGLIVSPDNLSAMRSSRLKNLGRSDAEQYAKTEQIQQELDYAMEVFKKLGDILIVDTTSKAMEEITAEIVQNLKL